MCPLRTSFLANALLQSSHLYDFSFSWTVLVCLFNSPFRGKAPLHFGHLKGLYPSWTSLICMSIQLSICVRCQIANNILKIFWWPQMDFFSHELRQYGVRDLVYILWHSCKLSIYVCLPSFYLHEQHECDLLNIL